MRAPVIGITGPIASGKTTVARLIAARGGALIDCDALGARALEATGVRRALVAAFGAGIMTAGGVISRRKLARVVFGSDRNLARLNRIVRPRLKRIITEEVLRRRAKAPYIVLDAVLLFQYKFKFKIDFVVVTRSSVAKRVMRIMRRDGVSRVEALERIERQKRLKDDWARADVAISTGGSLASMRGEARRIRDRFLAEAAARRKPR
ncbi:MAG: dephospho-CoA kinase [Candidatus Krumholzibacteria bacterium]|nr:dephospho-CoA kinase [Candidatus Krumholzibacteria bacterium]